MLNGVLLLLSRPDNSVGRAEVIDTSITSMLDQSRMAEPTHTNGIGEGIDCVDREVDFAHNRRVGEFRGGAPSSCRGRCTKCSAMDAWDPWSCGCAQRRPAYPLPTPVQPDVCDAAFWGSCGDVMASRRCHPERPGSV